MKIRSTGKITNRLSYNEDLGKKVKITIIDLDSEKEIKEKYEEVETISYEYDCTELEVANNKKYIENNLDTLYELGIEAEKNKIIEVSLKARVDALEDATKEIAEEVFNG